jgi:uncharacterized protein (TIGR02270 family)
VSTAPSIIPHIVEQHLEEAAFLWSQRCRAVEAPHYTLDNLCRLDERVEAHIDGLRVAGDAGWEMCEAALEEDDPGLVFAAAVIAYESLDGERIDAVVRAGSRSLADFRAAVSALGWLRDERFAVLRDSFLGANSIHYQRLAIAGCGIRRDDPGAALTKATLSSDLFLRARALKAAGELKRHDLLPELRENLEQENHTCRFAAARSMLLMGDHGALDPMRQFISSRSAFRLPAMQVALRCVDVTTAQDWLKSLAREPDQMRDVIIGAGIVGDPAYVPSLIKRMEDPELARVAAHAFSMITGVDISNDDFESGWPEGYGTGPNDELSDDNVELDSDEDLPWPKWRSVSQWWSANEAAFNSGARYIAGQPIGIKHCLRVLEVGSQWQRYAAAIEISLDDSKALPFNTKAPAFRQFALLQSV